MELRTYLKDNTLLFDGGMGTYFSQRNHCPGSGCELADLSQPELIADIHREYLDAGAQALKTNTFGVNRPAMQGDEELAERVISAGWSLASKAAQEKGAYVFADIGPIAADTAEEQEREYRWVVDRFLALGAKHFLFETNSTADALTGAVRYLRQHCPEAYTIVTFAVQPDGFSRDGQFVTDLLDAVRGTGAVDAAGLNCVCGARHMLELAQTLPKSDIPLVLMPNAGYPVVVNNRTFYDGDPAYFAAQLAEMARMGARILGGCCGTTPAHIACVKKALAAPAAFSAPVEKAAPQPETAASEQSAFWTRLQKGERPVAVELDPPADADLTKFMHGAAELKQAGVDIITIADCPIARARMDSSLLACKVHRELGVEALPHMTCRDRNLNATKALLLGLYAEGVRNVLLVTGDPIPTAERDEVKSVYQFNSRKLAAFASALGQQVLPSPMHLFGALNVNARNFDVQISLAKQKMEKGIVGFLTQPVLTETALENLKRAKEELPGAYLMGGIIPVVSARNARFMDSEINGINVDPRITELYEGKDRAEGEELAVKISVTIAREIAPYVSGFYLMTPFQRTGLMCRILDGIRAEELAD